jgi:hypothetical protein
MKIRSLRNVAGFALALATLYGPVAWRVASTSTAAPEKSLDGYWLSEGYGLFAEFHGDRLQLYEVTPISCLAGEAFRLNAEPSDPRGARFVSGEDKDPVFLTPGPSADSEWLHAAGAASSILFHRAAQRPKACSRTTPNDPETNFEIYWQTFAAHHGFLKLRGVDWLAAYKTYRPKVNAGTTPEELFNILTAMTEPLHDAHTGIDSLDLNKRFRGKRPGTLELTDEEKSKTVEIIEKNYLRGPLRSWCNGHLRYARLKQGAGYFRIDLLSRYTEKHTFDSGLDALDAALDEVMKDVQQLQGLVIDVRINGGGEDPYGVQIAGRLTDKPYIAFIKRARNDAQNPDSWTAPQPSTARPGDRPHFLGKVVELTGGDTVSGGETFTMALMGRQPHVTRIGENTQGVYSDVLIHKLPNGWSFGLPNEVFLTEGGKHFEATGVPPDIRVPVFPKEDLQSGRDGALERALEILSKNSPSPTR